MTIATTLARTAALLTMLACARCAGTLDDPAAFTRAGPDAGAADEATVDAATAPQCPDVPTVLAQSCGLGGCHDATTKAEALDLVSPGLVSRLVGVPAAEGVGLLVDPAAPSSSVLYTKLLAAPPFGARMPTGSSLDDGTIQCVLAWITSAATAPPATDGGVSADVEAGGPVVDASADTTSRDGGATFSAVRVAAGQSQPVTDAHGRRWSADADFAGGTAAVASPAVAIAGTDSPALYNGQRYGNPVFSYAFAVPDGVYTVTLKFAETYVTGPGMRLFGISIDGAVVEPSFDIYATAGAANTAVDRAYQVTASGGTLQIDFTQGSIQLPKVDAIEIVQAAPGDGG